MSRRNGRRISAVLIAAGIAAGITGAAMTGSASAELPAKATSQIATPPPPGSGVTITIEQPQPLGPLSLT